MYRGVVILATLIVISTGAVSARNATDDLRWTEIARSPFGAHDPIVAWTGDTMLVVNRLSGRVASYDPDSDTWARLARAPEPPGRPGVSAWTGTELIVFPSRLVGPPLALDVAENAWQSLAPMPPDMFFVPEFAVWTGEDIVLAGGNPPQAARFAPVDGTWTRLGRPPGGLWIIGLTWTGTHVIAETQDFGNDPIQLSLLEPGHDDWVPAAPSPVSATVSSGVWANGSLVYLRKDDKIAGPESDAAYDALTDSWRHIERDCPVHTVEALAAGSLIIDHAGRHAFDIGTGECTPLDRPSAGIYGGGARVWTGEEAIFWSGIESLVDRPKRRGAKLLGLGQH